MDVITYDSLFLSETSHSSAKPKTEFYMNVGTYVHAYKGITSRKTRVKLQESSDMQTQFSETQYIIPKPAGNVY